jgi:hypothetical protein
MKYIISQQRLNNFILEYLDNWVKGNNVNGFDMFITITSRDIFDDFEDEIYIEYDYEDGRLFVDEQIRKHFMGLFNKDKDDLDNILKTWFENKYGVDIKYVD